MSFEFVDGLDGHFDKIKSVAGLMLGFPCGCSIREFAQVAM